MELYKYKILISKQKMIYLVTCKKYAYIKLIGSLEKSLYSKFLYLIFYALCK